MQVHGSGSLLFLASVLTGLVSLPPITSGGRHHSIATVEGKSICHSRFLLYMERRKGDPLVICSKMSWDYPKLYCFQPAFSQKMQQPQVWQWATATRYLQHHSSFLPFSWGRVNNWWASFYSYWCCSLVSSLRWKKQLAVYLMALVWPSLVGWWW